MSFLIRHIDKQHPIALAYLILLAISVILLPIPKALACWPCTEYTQLDEAIKKADLIVIGSGIPGKISPQPQGALNVLAFSVSEVLKGTLDEKTILVDANWTNRCVSAPLLSKDKTDLLILKSSGESAFYRAVDICGEKQFELIEDILYPVDHLGNTILDKPFMPLVDFKKKYFEANNE